MCNLDYCTHNICYIYTHRYTYINSYINIKHTHTHTYTYVLMQLRFHREKRGENFLRA